MVPNQPQVDSSLLLTQAVTYANQNQISNVVADPGTYYFLTLQAPNGPNSHVFLDQIRNMTINFQGSDLIFTHPMYYGIFLNRSTNVVLENFTVDYQPLPFTQLRVTSVNPAAAQIQYSVEPGFADPSTFNALPVPQGQTRVAEVHLFRSGQRPPNFPRLAAQMPFSGSSLTLAPYAGLQPTPDMVAKIRPGDIMVVAMRTAIGALFLVATSGCAVRNVRVFSSTQVGVETVYSDHYLAERVYVMPKPGTDRLVSTFDGVDLRPTGPGNKIHLSRSIRTMDDGIDWNIWVTGQVQSQPSSRSVVAQGNGIVALSQRVTIPNGSPVAFERSSDGAILGSAVVVSQSAISSTAPYQVTFTFDRDLPTNLAGTFMYTTDLDQLGANSTIERNAIVSGAIRGIVMYGAAGLNVRGNHIRDAGEAGIMGYQILGTNDFTVSPVLNTGISNNVVDRSNLVPFWLGYQLAGIQVSTVGSGFNLMSSAPNQNVSITNNFIANPGRSAVWVSNTAGGSVAGNYFLNPNDRPDFGGLAFPNVAYAAAIPLVVDSTATGISISSNVIDTTSSRMFVTDTQYRELAAYAPGTTIRLNAYNIGALRNPAVALTGADGKTSPVTVQQTGAHAIDVQLPAAAGLGGAYLTLTSGATQYFGTLFIDSEDNIPAVNGCTYEASPSSSSVPASGSNLPILVVTQAGCSYQVLAADPFVTPGSTRTGTTVISVDLAVNTGAARSTTIEIAGQPITLTQAATAGPYITSVVNAASSLPPIASSSWITITGSQLSSTTRTWDTADFAGSNLPTQLDGVSAKVNGIPAYVYYISPTQLNVLSPDDSTVGPVQVQVTNSLGTTAVFSVAKAALAPALFPFTSTYAAAVHLNGAYVGPPGLISGGNFSPARTGETIELFGTGFGPAIPPSPAGTILAAPAPLANPVTVTIGGLPAQVLFAGVASNGLVQLNVVVPAGVPSGPAPVLAAVGGTTTQLNLSLSIQSLQPQIVQGTLGVALSSTCQIIGWARDPNNAAPIQVRLYRDGDAASGTLLTTFVADLPRSDLPFPDQNHGFDQKLGTNPLLADGKVHAILAYGVTASGAVGPLSGNGKTIQCSP